MKIEDRITKAISDNKDTIDKLLGDKSLIDEIESSALAIADTICGGGIVYAFGNGGSAADAQHIVSELVGRFKLQRNGYRAVALSTEGALMTSLANDFGFDEVFARQIEALGMPGDIAIAISTSGSSPNVLKGIKAAKGKGIVVIGLTGKGGGKMPELCDFCITIPSEDTPRIQEAHVLVYHILCELAEQAVCTRK